MWGEDLWEGVRDVVGEGVGRGEGARDAPAVVAGAGRVEVERVNGDVGFYRGAVLLEGLLGRLVELSLGGGLGGLVGFGLGGWGEGEGVVVDV